MPQLSIHLLGSYQVLLDGAPVIGFESDKVRALLAYLVIEAARPHRRRRWLLCCGQTMPSRPRGAACATRFSTCVGLLPTKRRSHLTWRVPPRRYSSAPMAATPRTRPHSWRCWRPARSTSILTWTIARRASSGWSRPWRCTGGAFWRGSPWRIALPLRNGPRSSASSCSSRPSRAWSAWRRATSGAAKPSGRCSWPADSSRSIPCKSRRTAR